MLGESGSRLLPPESEDATIAPRSGDGSVTSDDADEKTIIRDFRIGRSGSDNEATVIHPAAEQEEADRTILFAAAPKKLGYLVERAGPRASHVHHLGVQTNIGRGPENDIVVDDTGTSRAHARIRLEDGSFVLYDLASTNGTYVISAEAGKTKVQAPHLLKEGEVIGAGRTEFIFMEVDEGVLGRQA